MFPHLTGPDRRAYRTALVTGYTIGVEVEVLNSDDRVLASLRPRVVDGQVALDMDAPIQRVVSLTLVDEDNRLGFDSEDLDDGHLYADRQLRVTSIIDAPGLTEPVRVPAGCGPIAAMSRQGASLTVEVHDRGAYGMGDAWRSKSWPKGTRKTAIIRDILTDYMGETRLGRVPHQRERVRKAFNLTEDDKPWEAAQGLAESMGMRLTYRADGRVTLEDPRESTAWRFTDGDGGSMLSTPVIAPDFTTVVNAVDVTGSAPDPKPRKLKAATGDCAPTRGRDRGDASSGVAVEKRRPRTARAVAPRRHPLSPYRIGRNGVPRFLVARVENTALKTEAAVDRVARRTLREGLREGTTVTFDALPIYHLEPGDLVSVHGLGAHSRFRPRQVSWSLTGSGAMSVGYVKAISPRKAGIR